MRQPALKKVKYLAGQYSTVIQNIEGRLHKRPYSFSSSPSTSKFLSITVKKIANGVFSNHMHSALKVGDLLEIYEPTGTFVADAGCNADQLVLWGVGSGITPLYAIICETLANSPQTKVYLIYGSKNRNNTIFLRELIALQAQYPEHFMPYFFYSNAGYNDEFFENEFKDRIDFEKIKFIFSKIKDKKILHYICGPLDLKEAVEKELLYNGFNQKDIFTESFQKNYKNEDFIDINDNNIVIIINGKKNIVFVPKGQSILEAALDNNLDMPYSCQVGNCSSCVANCVEGSIKMVGLNYKRDDLLDNQYLLCCSFPKTNDVTIIINN